MEYKGKLYGKVGGSYCPLIQTTDDYEAMEKEIVRLKQAVADLKVQNVSYSNKIITAASALDRIANMHRMQGREGCTWGDTEYDSLSATAGYNEALDDAGDCASKALKEINQ